MGISFGAIPRLRALCLGIDYCIDLAFPMRLRMPTESTRFANVKKPDAEGTKYRQMTQLMRVHPISLWDRL